MRRPRFSWRALAAIGALTSALAVSCSGGGGGGGGGGGDVTTFRGNLANQSAFLRSRPATPSLRARVLELLTPVRIAYAQVGGVEVCVEGTAFCTTTDETGSFTLPADVSGVVTLVFTGADFVARITLPDVPAGATINLGGIDCSTSTGLCEADDIDVDEPSDVAGEPSEPSNLEPSDPSEPSPSAAGDVSDVSESSSEGDVSGPDDGLNDDDEADDEDEPSVDSDEDDDPGAEG